MRVAMSLPAAPPSRRCRSSRLRAGPKPTAAGLSAMSGSYRGTGSASYHPALLLGILIYGYATGVFSSRKLERTTYDSVAFRFIAANDQPDHGDRCLTGDRHWRAMAVSKFPGGDARRSCETATDSSTKPLATHGRTATTELASIADAGEAWRGVGRITPATGAPQRPDATADGGGACTGP
jgi:Transposase domain (DUF772)